MNQMLKARRMMMLVVGYMALYVAFLVHTSTAFKTLNGIYGVRCCGNIITRALHVDGQRSNHYLHHRYNTRRHMDVSVGEGTGGSDESAPKSKQNFIIAPTIDGAPDEMLILDNFNKIQFGGSRKIAVLGTSSLATDSKHEQMIELLSYALVLSGNHIFTSGGGATNSAVIRGALRACNSNLLTVILPQSLMKQPAEMQPLLSRVVNVEDQPQYDDMDLKEAATECNTKILGRVDEALAFVFHDSTTLIDAVDGMGKSFPSTKFFLD